MWRCYDRKQINLAAGVFTILERESSKQLGVIANPPRWSTNTRISRDSPGLCKTDGKMRCKCQQPSH